MMATAGQPAGYEIRVLGRDGGWRRMQCDTVADRGTELMYGVGAQIVVGEPADGVARAPVGTWVRQGRAGTFIWSDELYAMFCIPVGTPLMDGLIRSRIHPRDYPLVEQVWRARLAEGEAHGVRFRTILTDGLRAFWSGQGGRWFGAVAARSRSASSRSMSRPGWQQTPRPRLRADPEGHAIDRSSSPPPQGHCRNRHVSGVARSSPPRVDRGPARPDVDQPNAAAAASIRRPSTVSSCCSARAVRSSSWAGSRRQSTCARRRRTRQHARLPSMPSSSDSRSTTELRGERCSRRPLGLNRATFSAAHPPSTL